MDFTKFIEPTTLKNSDENGNELPSFQTTDLVFLESWKEIEDDSKIEKFVYPTDYAVMNNAVVSSEGSCAHYLRNVIKSTKIHIVWFDGNSYECYPANDSAAICPAMHLRLDDVVAELRRRPKAFGMSKVGRGSLCHHTLEFGEYPKSFVGKSENIKLEELFNQGKLVATGKTYSGASLNREYSYDGHKYVRVQAKLFGFDPSNRFRKEMTPQSGTYLWVKVEPIVWRIKNWNELPKEINPNGTGEATFIDVKTEEAIVAGIPFHPTFQMILERNGQLWQNSSIRGYLNGIDVNNIKTNGNPKFAAQHGGDFSGKNNFLAEALNFDLELNMEQETKKESEVEPRARKSRLERLNPDTTPIGKRREMTDTEIIKTWIDAGQSVLLRGPSGIGKTERIKTLYPNLIYLKLTNNMFPEKVVGSINLQTGQSIPPNFARQAILQCASEDEKKLVQENIQNLYEIADQIYERSKNSNEKVVILLDELLNVKPAIQSLVYTLVLNKVVETGKGLKLPANTVVVATGNQKKFSQVAEDLAEPLEKRFDHIFDMRPKVSEWLYEYAIPKKLHPLVISYIFSSYQANKSVKGVKGVAKSCDISYFYEDPEVGELNLDENGCRGKTNDPRGWTSLSNTLYALEEDLKNGKFVGLDVEKLLKTTIRSKLREEWAADFFDFYNRQTLSIEDIVEGNYGRADLPMDVNEKFSYIAALLSADEKQVGACREFIRKYCDPEYLSVFDLYWAGNDEKRMEKLVELQEVSSLSKDVQKDSKIVQNGSRKGEGR